MAFCSELHDGCNVASLCNFTLNPACNVYNVLSLKFESNLKSWLLHHEKITIVMWAVEKMALFPSAINEPKWPDAAAKQELMSQTDISKATFSCHRLYCTIVMQQECTFRKVWASWRTCWEAIVHFLKLLGISIKQFRPYLHKLIQLLFRC